MIKKSEILTFSCYNVLRRNMNYEFFKKFNESYSRDFFFNYIWPLSLGVCLGAKSLQSCPNLCNPMGWSLPGSPVHWILQARILEWVTMTFSRGSSQLIGQTQGSSIRGRFLTVWEHLYGHLTKIYNGHYMELSTYFSRGPSLTKPESLGYNYP